VPSDRNDTCDETPHETANDASQERRNREAEPMRLWQQKEHGSRSTGTRQQLALASDVEDTCCEGNRRSQRRQNERRCCEERLSHRRLASYGPVDDAAQHNPRIRAEGKDEKGQERSG
jgi:hypothetical protein